MQGCFWDDAGRPASVPHARTDTSAAAARSVRETAATKRQRVLEAIRRAGARGLTDEEGAVVCRMRDNTYRPRRWDLSRSTPPAIVKAGRRATSSGRMADAWVAAELAP